jgi:hypothetical protein
MTPPHFFKATDELWYVAIREAEEPITTYRGPFTSLSKAMIALDKPAHYTLDGSGTVRPPDTN